MGDIYYDMGSFFIRDHNLNYDSDGIYHRKDDEIHLVNAPISEQHPTIKAFLKKFGFKTLEGLPLKRLEQYTSVVNKNLSTFSQASRENIFFIFDKMDRLASLIGVDLVQTPLFKELTKMNRQWGCYLYIHIAEKEKLRNKIERLETVLKDGDSCVTNNADYQEKIKQLTAAAPRDKIRLLLDQVNAEINSNHFQKGTSIDLRDINDCLVNAEILASESNILEEFTEKINGLRHRAYVAAVASYINFLRTERISVDIESTDMDFNALIDILNTKSAKRTFPTKEINEIKNEAKKIRKDTYREVIKTNLNIAFEFAHRGEVDATLKIISKTEKLAQRGSITDEIKKNDIITLKRLAYHEAVKKIIIEAKIKAAWGLVGEDAQDQDGSIVPDASTMLKEAKHMGKKGGVWSEFVQETTTLEQNGFRKKIEVLLKSAERDCEKNEASFLGLSSLKKAKAWIQQRNLIPEFKNHIVTVQLKCQER